MILFVLWDKFIDEIGGLKPATEFTCHKRGLKRNKFKCSHRLIVLKCMEHLIARGANTVAVAVQKTERVYGCVTMNRMVAMCSFECSKSFKRTSKCDNEMIF